jgi:formate hydrogenlyase subunit 3/multisubunit Na+/H+ antiporter MnhD subunit
LVAAILSGVLWLLITVVTLVSDPSGRQVLQVVGAAALVSGFSFALVTEDRRRNRT